MFKTLLVFVLNLSGLIWRNVSTVQYRYRDWFYSSSRGRKGSSLHQNGVWNPYVLLTSVADTHHFDADPDPFHFDPDPFHFDLDPTFYSDADTDLDPDPTFPFDADPALDPTTRFSPDLEPVLQKYHLRLPVFHFDTDMDPALHFDAVSGSGSSFHFDPDPDPASQNVPDPQHCL